MKTETLSGVIESAFGAKLPEPVKYSGSFDAYEKVDEVKSANDMPSDDEVVSFRNTQKRNNKRQQLMSDALESAAKAFTAANGDKVTNPYVKPTLESSADLRYKTIYDALIAAGKSPEEAKNTAEAALA